MNKTAQTYWIETWIADAVRAKAKREERSNSKTVNRILREYFRQEAKKTK